MLNLTISLQGASTAAGQTQLSEPVITTAVNNLVYVYDFPGLGNNLQPINPNNVADQINVLLSIASKANGMLGTSPFYLSLSDIQSKVYLWSYTANDLYNLLQNIIYVLVVAVNATNKPMTELTKVDIAPFVNVANLTVDHVMLFLNSVSFNTTPQVINQTTEDYINSQINFAYQAAKSVNKPMINITINDVQTYMDSVFKTNPGLIATLPSATQIVNLINVVDHCVKEVAKNVSKNPTTINLSDIQNNYVDNAKVTSNNIFTYVAKLTNLQTFGITEALAITISSLGFFVQNARTFVWLKILFSGLLALISLICFFHLIVGNANGLKFALTVILCLFLILQVVALGLLPSSKATAYTFLGLFIAQILITLSISFHPACYNTAEGEESLIMLGIISICDALVLGACSAVMFNNDNLTLPTNNNWGMQWLSNTANNLAYYFNMLSLKYAIK